MAWGGGGGHKNPKITTNNTTRRGGINATLSRLKEESEFFSSGLGCQDSGGLRERESERERDVHLVMCFVFDQSRDWRDWRGLS